MFNSAVSKNDDPTKDYPPLFKIGVPTDKDGNVIAGIFDGDGNPSTWDTFIENIGACEVCCIFKVPAVYFMNKAFGLTVQLYSLQYFLRASSKNPFCPQPRKRANDTEGDAPEAKSPRLEEEPEEGEVQHNDGINFC